MEDVFTTLEKLKNFFLQREREREESIHQGYEITSHKFSLHFKVRKLLGTWCLIRLDSLLITFALT